MKLNDDTFAAVYFFVAGLILSQFITNNLVLCVFFLRPTQPYILSETRNGQQCGPTAESIQTIGLGLTMGLNGVKCHNLKKTPYLCQISPDDVRQ